MSEKVNLEEKLAQIDKAWTPHVVGELNGQFVKLAKFEGEFCWHHHEDEDELFLVVAGDFELQLRDKTVHLTPGEFYIVPRGVEHKPVVPAGEAHVLLFEPASTLNTGNVQNERTLEDLKRI